MTKNNSLIDELPETTHEFQIELNGRVTNRRYVGEFQCKIPTIKDQSLIAKHTAIMNGEFPIYLDSGIQKIHRMISYLRYTLIEYPLFWKNSDLGYELRDDNIIEAVYDAVLAFENEWLSKIWGKDEGSSEE